MAHVTADRVRDTSTTTGTGAFSVSGTAPTGYRTFSAVLSTSDTCWYAIQHQTAAEWEVGLGTYSSLNTITRTTVLASSNAGSAVNFSAGTKDIFITLAATKTVQQDNSGAVAIDANSSSNALRITQTGAGNALLVEDSANPDATPFVVNANGVVGIGEASPSSYLSAGMVLRSSSAFTPQILVWNTTNDSNAPNWVTRKDRAGAIVNNGDTLGTFVFQGYDGANYRNAAYIGATVDGTPGASDMPGRLVFFTTPDGSISAVERMRIDSSGNVGIGTGSPSQKLTVNGVASALSFLLATNQHLIYDLDATNIAIRIGAAGPFYSIGTTGFANLRLNNASGGDILFAQAGTERMRITSAGNVGIGTSSPDALLTVNTIASFGDGAAATPSIAHKGDLNTGFWFPAADTIAASTAGTERMRITSAGDVGIGTSSPGSKLTVAGTIESTSGGVKFPDGTTQTTATSGVNVQTFTSSGTWTKPTGYAAGSRVLVQVWGAGASGARHSTATSASGGGGGGYNEAWLSLSQFGATETITIGAGGASRTGSNQAGAAGGNTTVGSLITAYGGGGGAAAASASGGGGGGQLSAGSAGTGNYSAPGKPFVVAYDTDGASTFQIRQGSGNYPFSALISSSDLAANWHGGGGGGGSATATYRDGCPSVWGGGGGAGGSGGTGGTSSFGGNGGASGATGTAGTQPGGGGGSGTSTSGAGGDGQVIITVFAA